MSPRLDPMRSGLRRRILNSSTHPIWSDVAWMRVHEGCRRRPNAEWPRRHPTESGASLGSPVPISTTPVPPGPDQIVAPTLIDASRP